MPPKGTKSPRTKSPKSGKPGGSTWESLLSSVSANQDNWITFVCFLTPDCAVNQIYVDLIEKAMQNGVRRRFDFISKRDLLEAIKALGKASKTAAKSVSTNSTVASLTNSPFLAAYEYAKSILDTGGEIDDQLWAKLIKCRILDLKKEVQNRTILKAASTPATSMAPKAEKSKSPGGKKSPKPAAAAKKQTPGLQPSATDTHIEKSTGVKTRDQIINETKYIDDEPNDGPNQYIFLSGFYSTGLLNALDSVEIHIDTITNISCDSLNETKHLFDEMIQRDRQEQSLKADVLKDILTPEQIAQQNERNDQILNNFWKTLMPLLDNAPDRSMLQDIIVTTLKVSNDDVPDSWSNTEQRIKLAQSLYNSIVENSFRLNIRKRQFNTFNQQMKVVTIPTIEEKTIETITDAKIYNEITTTIPPESISIPLILHGILEQVEAQTNNVNKNTSNQQDDVGRYLREKLMSLSMGKEQQKEIENLVPKSPFSKATGSGPLMIYNGDDIKQRLATLNRLAILDPIKVEHNFIMSHSRLTNLPELSSKKIDDSESRERQARLNQFLHFCTDEELLLSDVDHILKQFVFECMPINLTTTDNSNEQQTSRPSSAENNNHEDEQLRFERRLSTLVDEENKQAINAQPIIWDDPFELLIINEQTGRIGISAETLPSSPTGRSSRGSILRMRAQSPKRSVYTVRFDVNNPDNNLYQQMSHLMPPVGGANVDGTIQNITQYHKRNLNDWNFAEHFEPDVFAQVIEQALFTHSHINVYYNRRDNTHMIILSLPVPEGKTIGYENTSKKLFSDVGFRNFLDEISYEIVDWLRDEEAKYQADILAQEVRTYVRQTTPTPDTLKTAAATIEGAGKKGKAAAGKKTSPTRSPSVSSDSGNSSEEEKAIRDDYVHPTSLKAWKQKKDKETVEQEQQVKAKRPPSGNRSPKAKSPRAAEKAAKPPTPREKSPKGTKTKRPTSATSSEKAAGMKTPQESNEPIERFIGYSLGNRLLSAQCSTSHLLLPDGCFVRSRIDTLKQGSTCVSTSLYRNKSSYKIQLINPNKASNTDNQPSTIEQNNTDETTKPTDDNHPTATTEKRVAEYGVFTAILNSGMILSCSNYDTKAPKEAPPPEPPAPEIPVEEKVEDKKKEAAGAKGKKKGKAVEAETPPAEKPPAEPQYEAEPFQRLTISIPTGLVVTYYPETFLGVKPTEAKQPHKLVVKQYYPCQSKGFHTCEQSRLTAYEENSRIIDAEGHVMIFKRDGEVTILQPDGGMFMKTIVHQNEPEIEVPVESPHSAKKESKGDFKGKKKSDAKQETDVSTITEEVKQNVYQWKCITADGQLFIQNSTNQEYEKVDQLRLILETNPKTNEQVIHREDKVIIVFRSDGSRVISFADGTRITTYEAVEQKNNSPTNQETDERNNSMLGFRKIPHVKVEALGYATVAFNCQTTDCRTVFNDGSSIDVFADGTYSIFESDGEKFDINDNGDVLLDFQQSIYAKRVQELLSNIEPSKCILSQNGDLIFDAVDHEQTQYCVETSGETYSKETDQRQMTKTMPLEMHVPRFFIVHEDGSGTELLRFKDLYSYLRTMDLDPSTAVVREPLLSNPKVTGATVMRPFQDEVHRRWLTSFDGDSVVPPSLRNYTSATAMTRSYSSMSESNNSSTNNLNTQDNAILRQTGKNNQQQQFKSTTLTTGLSNQQPLLEMPKALDYRNFMEFPRLQDDTRIKLFTSLKSYIDFVKNRADYHTKLLPHDNRNDLTLLYLKTVHPDRQKTTTTRQSVVPLSKKFNLDHLNDELKQEKFNKQLKNDIKKGITMPYFKSEWGMAYIQQQQTENVLTRESRSAEAIKSSYGNQSLMKSPPNSPTDQQNRLSQVRKSQPARSVSTEAEDNKTIGGSGQHDQEGVYRPVKQFIPSRGYVQYNAYGNKRAHPIKIPTGLKGSRPNAQPHSRFLDMEEPVMVRPNNASIGTAALNNRPLRERRGCELFPDRIDFGILKEGVTYGAEIEIKNVGIDACRFRIRQPPLGTGLRVVFQPGLLAAGIRRSIMIELYAIIKQNQNQNQNQSQQQLQQQQQSQGLYQLDQSIELITETDIMHFPIRAKIASEEQFDIMFVNKDETAGMSKSIRLLARKGSNSNDWFANTNENSMIPTNE
ncbi:unnamed protein product [Rotaria sp. Silwood1]|nr:unnamed protein product [Rotaria sp. Silwood1]CAF1097113.1 unnamed protein product [Rotaria sp. Silwood1]CAF3342558.1 unnamed protein product [Rotaria sp. Silwood1]CAF4596445.1 unnamed protein product [Rotaria sp. Silwood1]